MTAPKETDSYNEKETEQRREAALKKMLETPPKPHELKKKKLSRKLAVSRKPR